jgi:hypothetical protein
MNYSRRNPTFKIVITTNRSQIRSNDVGAGETVRDLFASARAHLSAFFAGNSEKFLDRRGEFGGGFRRET